MWSSHIKKEKEKKREKSNLEFIDESLVYRALRVGTVAQQGFTE